MFCPKCGAQNADDIAICTACGADLQQHPQAPQPPQMPVLPPKTSPMAIWSLILGIAGLVTCGLGSIAGVILGILGLKQVKEKPTEFTGSGLAIAGIVVSCLTVFIGIFAMLAAVLFPVFARARESAYTSKCQLNVKQLGQAMMMYSNDYDSKYPPAANWCDLIKPHVKKPTDFKCPAVIEKECGYGFNSALGGISEGQITNPADLVSIFESDGGWNANGARDAMIAKPRHMKFSVGFADTHVEGVYPNNESRLQWSISR